MTTKPLTDEQRLILRLERARDEAPMSEPEARAFLEEAGVDVGADFKLMMQRVAEREETARRQRLQDMETKSQQLQSRPRAPAPRRTREQNQARVRMHQARNPELSAQHHNLTHMTDEDLASLVEHLDELDPDAQEE